MHQFIKNIGLALVWILIATLGLVIVFLLLSLVTINLFSAGYVEGPGSEQFLKACLGIALLFIIPCSWLALIISTFHHLSKGHGKQTLMPRIALIGSVLMYFFPVVILIYHFTFPLPMTVYQLGLPVEWWFVDWVLAAITFVIASISLHIYFSAGPERSTQLP